MDDDDDLNLPETPTEELARLARETVEAQSGKLDSEGSRARCQRVIDLYTQGEIRDGGDYFHAAWIMLCGEVISHFDLSRQFARRATELGEERAWTLRAMATDRLLVARGKPQRYGTQMIKQAGRWSLGPVANEVSDAERAFFAVPPLFEQRQRAEYLQRQEDRENDA